MISQWWSSVEHYGLPNFFFSLLSKKKANLIFIYLCLSHSLSSTFPSHFGFEQIFSQIKRNRIYRCYVQCVYSWIGKGMEKKFWSMEYNMKKKFSISKQNEIGSNERRTNEIVEGNEWNCLGWMIWSIEIACYDISLLLRLHLLLSIVLFSDIWFDFGSFPSQTTETITSLIKSFSSSTTDKFRCLCFEMKEIALSLSLFNSVALFHIDSATQYLFS